MCKRLPILVLVPLLAWASLVYSQVEEPAPPAAAPPSVPVTETEKVAALQMTITADEQRLAEKRHLLEQLDADLKKAAAEFADLDRSCKDQAKALDKLKADQGSDAELESKLAECQERCQLAKKRLDLLVQERKANLDMAVNLEQKIRQDLEVMDKLLGKGKPAAAAPPAKAGKATAVSPAPAAPPAAVAPAPVSPAVPEAKAATPPAAAPPVKEERLPTKELVQARQQAQEKEQVAEAAEAEAESISQRLQFLMKDIAGQRKLLQMARQKGDLAYSLQKQHRTDLDKKSKENAPHAEINQAWLKLMEADQMAEEARVEIRTHTNQLTESQQALSVLQSEQLLAMETADDKRSEASAAQEKVTKLENPFAPHNMWRSFVSHGPNILIIVVAIVVLLGLIRLVTRRLVHLMVIRSPYGTQEERENRATTLVGVLHNTLMVGVVVGGVIMVLDEIGVPIVPLMGGAAVLGLAVAFGAQSLIKDYFSGFMILVENQYGLNDVVRIDTFSGQVERITLRVTVLRALDGGVHFIPHGQVNTVTNLTHGWSRALFDVGVAYKEDADRVIAVLTQLARDLRKDADYGPLMLEDMEMLGVDALGDSAIMIRFFIKTRPLKQWRIKRELLRRIKRRFDELGIEIPFPHRTVYHRQAEADSANPPMLVA